MLVKTFDYRTYANGPLVVQPFNYYLKDGSPITIYDVKTITYDNKMIIVLDKWYQSLLKKHLIDYSFMYCWNFNTNSVDILLINRDLADNLRTEASGRGGMFSLTEKTDSLILTTKRYKDEFRVAYNFKDIDEKIPIENYNKSELIDYISFPLDTIIKDNRLSNNKALKIISSFVKLNDNDANQIKMRQIKYFYKLNF